MLDTLTTVLEAAAAAPWVPAVVLLIALGDALFPPLPSEGLLVALAAVAAAGAGPELWLLAAAAATGAFLGDTLTFLVGRRHGPRRLARVTGPRSRRLLDRATATLDRRGALVVLTARYVPLGRVAVNLTAGATGFGPRRFAGLAALAAVSWAAWSVAVGALAGSWFDGNPLLGSAAGIGLALLLGVVVDRLARRLTGWGGAAHVRASDGARTTASAATQPAAPVPVPVPAAMPVPAAVPAPAQRG